MRNTYSKVVLTIITLALVPLVLSGCTVRLLRDPRSGGLVNCGSILEKGYIPHKECIKAYQKAGYELVE